MHPSHGDDFDGNDLVDDMKDPGLSMCSPATRGIWFDLLCVLHESGRSGQVTCTIDQFCRASRCTPAEFVAAIAELRTTQVAETHERDGNVTVICRRAQRKLKQRVLAAERVRRHRCNAQALHAPLHERYTNVTNALEETMENVTLAENAAKLSQIQEIADKEAKVKRSCNADVTLEQEENAYIYINTKENSSLEEKESIGAKKRKPKPPDPRSKHPAIVAVRSVTTRYPKKELWDEMIRFLGDKPDVPKMQSCYIEWIKRGYKPINYAWLFDWTITGIPEKGGFRNNGRPEIGKTGNDPAKSGPRRTTDDDGIRDCPVL